MKRWSLLVVFVAVVTGAAVLSLGRDQRAPARAAPLGHEAARAVRVAPVQEGQYSEASALLALSAAASVVAPEALSGELSGRVLNWEDGSPISDVDVTLRGPAGMSTTVTDRDGGFVARPMAHGEHSIVSLIADGYFPWAPDPDGSPLRVVFRPGMRITDVVLYLVPASTRHGRVVDVYGAAVGEAEVRVLTADRGEQAAAPIEGVYTVYTSMSDGRFVFQAPVGALLEARAPGFAPGRTRMSERASMSQELTIVLEKSELDVPPEQVISGWVVDNNGAAIEGARLAAITRDPLELGAEAVSDADGAFTLDALGQRSYAIRASARGYASTFVVARSGATDTLVTLVPGARIVGRVVNPVGEAIVAPTVIVRERAGLFTRAVAVVSTFDADGRFEVEGLSPILYEVTAHAAGFGPSPPMPCIAEQTPEELLVRLTVGATVFGTVVDSVSGEPIDGAKVGFDGTVAHGSAVSPSSIARTRAGGSFELSGVSPGRASVTGSALGHHLATIGPLEFGDGDRVGPVIVELTPLGQGEVAQREFGGIGASVVVSGRALRIAVVSPGGGCDSAGLAAGDLILAIDREDVDGMSLDVAIQRIRGVVGTAVFLLVQRGDDASFEVSVTRMKVRD